MPRLLAVFAHPDDEGAIAGTLARYARQGAHVALVCATRGEAGEISDPSLATPETLGAVREAELRCACETIGVAELHLLDYCDSGMKGTVENKLPTAFINADPDEIKRKLVRIMRQVKPEVVITFEPFGWYGHPDHIAAGKYTTEAFYLASNARAYPGTGDDWRPLCLFHATFSRESFATIAEYAREHGLDTIWSEEESWDESLPPQEAITHVVDVTDYLDIKDASWQCHQTQSSEDDIFAQVPDEIRRQALQKEYFIQVFPPRDSHSAVASDLLAGIDS
jgi:LmbE family N-acetylglucosaminyl deacetylase